MCWSSKTSDVCHQTTRKRSWTLSPLQFVGLGRYTVYLDTGVEFEEHANNG